jgi:hypothetical protein
MHRYLFSLLIISFSGTLVGQTDAPVSMDEAAIRIIKQMNVDDLKRLVKIGPRGVDDFHFNWSDEILHQNRIWYADPNLRSECWDPEHFEGCNGVLETFVYRNSFNFVERSEWEDYQTTREKLEFVELNRELFYGQPLKVIVKNLRKELQRYNLDIGIELTGNVNESLKMSIRADIDYTNVLEVLERVKYEFHSSVKVEPNKILIHSRSRE